MTVMAVWSASLYKENNITADAFWLHQPYLFIMAGRKDYQSVNLYTKPEM